MTGEIIPHSFLTLDETWYFPRGHFLIRKHPMRTIVEVQHIARCGLFVSRDRRNLAVHKLRFGRETKRSLSETQFTSCFSLLSDWGLDRNYTLWELESFVISRNRRNTISCNELHSGNIILESHPWKRRQVCDHNLFSFDAWIATICCFEREKIQLVATSDVGLAAKSHQGMLRSFS